MRALNWNGINNAYGRVKQQVGPETDRGIALGEAIMAVRKGGTLSVLGVYGMMDKFPMGVVLNKGLTVRASQQHGPKYVPRLMDFVARGELEPFYLATHSFSLEDATLGHAMFKQMGEGYMRAVFAP